MGFLNLKFSEDVTEIILKDKYGHTNKIDVTATMNSKLKPGYTGRSIVRLEGELMTNVAEIEQSEKAAVQDDIIESMEVSKMLPSVEQARKMILNAEAEEPQQSYEAKELGLPSLEQIRKKL